jgi:hypothetical protein
MYLGGTGSDFDQHASDIDKIHHFPQPLHQAQEHYQNIQDITF